MIVVSVMSVMVVFVVVDVGDVRHGDAWRWWCLVIVMFGDGGVR